MKRYIKILLVAGAELCAMSFVFVLMVCLQSAVVLQVWFSAASFVSAVAGGAVSVIGFIEYLDSISGE